jgi:Fe2+ or Zn2+ uptake regulation protein
MFYDYGIDGIMVKFLNFLSLIILLSSFQCTRWQNYANSIYLEVEPKNLIGINDTVYATVQLKLEEGFVNRVDSAKLIFYYLSNDTEEVSVLNEVGKINLLSDSLSKAIRLKFQYEEGRNLYVKQLIKKNNKIIQSPLLLVAD